VSAREKRRKNSLPNQFRTIIAISMKSPSAILIMVALPMAMARALSPEQAVKLPAAAVSAVDFEKDIKPLFEASCVKCHAKGKDKGGLSIETRDALMKGGDTGVAVIIGKSAESLLVEAVSGLDPDTAMPKKGTKWTPEQVGLLRAWIDQGASWPAGITFAKPPAQNLQPHGVALAARPGVHPIDDVLSRYFAAKGAPFPQCVEDRVFARRAFLDIVGLLPTPEQLDSFLRDSAPDKRANLVAALLADRENYADHWLTFWNDLLRNDYKGTGFIDGGRKQISGWLRRALVENMPYDRFVAALVNPTVESEGFSRGIIWRGNVNASMLPPMQAAQNVSQVFLGINLKCASCHDSFVNDWSLADAYGMATIYADEALELVHCDKPTGKKAPARFLYPEIGALDGTVPKAERLKRLAEIMTSPKNGRLPRTMVNRLWARLMGRGLVEPLDDMDRPAWSRDLLDWLAEDFVAHHYNLQHTIAMICTSRAYSALPVEGSRDKEEYAFRGPLTRRMSAEQFADAISALSGEWARMPSSLEFDFGTADLRLPKWIWTDEPVELGPQRTVLRALLPQLEAAEKVLAGAQAKAAEAASTDDPQAIEQTRTAVEQATASVRAVETQVRAVVERSAGAVLAAKHNDRMMERLRELSVNEVLPESDRHKVIFRKKFPLAQVPAEAYGVVLASQGFQVRVNDREAKPMQRDGFRNGRIALLNLQPLLVAGENVIAIDVSSHTEKQINDSERKKYPGAITHLNRQSGVAFYTRLIPRDGKGAVEITSDETWRVRRNPDGAWAALAYADSEWASAWPLPVGVGPVDEGPSLEPVLRKDFANIPVELGPQLSPAVSIAAHTGAIRAPLLAADPLQVALDRPNHEIVLPARSSAATTIQALELTNGATLNARLQKAAAKFAADAARDPSTWLTRLYLHALDRPPSAAERALALDLIGSPAKPEGIADLLWALVNLPEFQLIN
jgi:mono/diheme cytochrome c family protein